MKNLSLKTKLFLLLLTVVISFSALTTPVINFAIDNLMHDHLVETGHVITDSIASHITNELLTGDLLEIHSFFEETIKNNPDVSYLFVKKDGRILVHAFENGFPEGLLDIGHNEGLTDHIEVDTGQERIMDFALPILDGEAGVLRMGYSGRMIREALDYANRIIMVIIFIAVIVSLGVSILISQQLTKPLSLLTNTALEISEGNYSKIVDIASDDEVGKLSHAFNMMLEAIKHREKELRDINSEMATVNNKLHQYIGELNKAKEELIKAKQDKAVIETTSTILHHLRQPLTYLVLAIEVATEELRKSGDIDKNELLDKLSIVDKAGKKMTEFLKKFEAIKEYKTIRYGDTAEILDIEE